MASTEVMRKEQNLPQSMRGRPVVMPLVDIFENDDEYMINTDLPGISADNLNVSLDRGELTVEGICPDEPDTSEALVREYRPRDYRRTFLVPDTIQADGISANLDDGVLTIRIPKAAAVKPRRIEIKVD